MENAAIAERLEAFAGLLDLAGSNPYTSRAYRRAAETIRATQVPIEELVRGGRVQELRGIGPGIAARLRELGARVLRPREPVQDRLLRLRTDARRIAEPACPRRLPQLVRSPNAEGPSDLHHPRRADPEEAPEADQLRLHLPLELVELRDRPRLDWPHAEPRPRAR